MEARAAAPGAMHFAAANQDDGDDNDDAGVGAGPRYRPVEQDPLGVLNFTAKILKEYAVELSTLDTAGQALPLHLIIGVEDKTKETVGVPMTPLFAEYLRADCEKVLARLFPCPARESSIVIYPLDVDAAPFKNPDGQALVVVLEPDTDMKTSSILLKHRDANRVLCGRLADKLCLVLPQSMAAQRAQIAAEILPGAHKKISSAQGADHEIEARRAKVLCLVPFSRIELFQQVAVEVMVNAQQHDALQADSLRHWGAGSFSCPVLSSNQSVFVLAPSSTWAWYHHRYCPSRFLYALRAQRSLGNVVVVCGPKCSHKDQWCHENFTVQDQQGSRSNFPPVPVIVLCCLENPHTTAVQPLQGHHVVLSCRRESRPLGRCL